MSASLTLYKQLTGVFSIKTAYLTDVFTFYNKTSKWTCGTAVIHWCVLLETFEMWSHNNILC